ncbi:hypothetical protein KR215_007211 [Drosophila sulfurigaster]|uniref:RE1-silencing transcription factor-like n=1 Tax=Drosophila albomicans TaxID=7291 RepID=A0A6P8Y812_DROAB|nr:RE1-silencing transcription factor-like [Drosophila albomicans]XP_034104538.1 RE1-silencing transcription factor-like [Drosophila albomicans]XP_060653909.1 RE1-silencing transcription factor-like [Drosophila nasuta]XP_060653910.1 RE1-silencing transcription factor-like [Drosophila nasuta]XP_062137019.1 RE1-silencing transcription factor-like [Drosophila sulfurigaster albostrigata]KAH8403958.1 hypothetical protein KR215_007211 [Drosophila sulfurigaster]
MESDKIKQKYSVVFRCTVTKCSYTTKRLFNLQRHAKTHTKEHWRSKRFPCPCCAYAAATRAHLRRHMANKHPTEDISAHDLTVLSYEEVEQMERKHEESQVKEEKSEFIEGPVTVLQMVTPLSPQTEPLPGEMYCNVTLEGEAFRLIPVALLPAEEVKAEL